MKKFFGLKTKNFLTLRWKITFFFTLVVLFFGLTLGYLIYKSNEKLILSSIGSQAESISKSAATHVDVDDFQKILKKIEEQPEPYSLDYAQKIVDTKEFREMNGILDKYRISQGVKYVYTMAFLSNGEFVYVVDGYTILDKVTNGVGDAGISPPGKDEKDESLIKSAKKVYQTEDVVRGELVVADDWGALLSSYTPIKDKEGNVIGVIGADIDGKEIFKQLNDTKKHIILFTSIVMLVAISLSFVFARWITKPLSSFASNVNHLKEGDFTVEFKLESKDEFGTLSDSLRSTTLELNNMIKVINDSAENLTNSSENLLRNSNESSRHADLTVEKIQQLKEKYKFQTDYVRNSVQTFHEMSEKFDGINLKTNNVYELSDSVTNAAKKGKEQMESTIVKMDDLLQFQNEYSLIVSELTDKTKEIHEIISTISDISESIDVLSLNAGIEAEKAGIHGYGFKVVASEVKRLAEETSRSVEHVSDLVSNIQNTVNKTVERIDESSGFIRSSSLNVKESGNLFLSIMDEIYNVNDVLKDMKVDSQQMFQDTKHSIASIEEIMKLTLDSSDIVHKFEEDLVEQQSQIRNLDNETVSLSLLSKTLHDLIRKFKTK